MQIRELYLKHFGKFSDQRIQLFEGINLFYGENESGKSTIFGFIKGMLFGMERGRGRASKNDAFSLFEPWENSNYYAGALRFESGGKLFYLERNFDKYAKSASLICEDDGEEFSLEHGDLHMLLGGISASGFENTVAVGQLRVETNQSLAAELRNYAANYYASGNSDIDLEGALQILRNQKKEIEKQVKEEAAKKQKLRVRIEQEASYVRRDLHSLDKEKHSIESQLAIHKEQGGSSKEASYRPLETAVNGRVNPFIALAPIIGIVIAVILLAHPWDYLAGSLLVLADMLYIWRRRGEGNKIQEKLSWEHSLLKESIKEKQTQFENLQEQLAELDEMSEDFHQQDKKRQAIDLAIDRLGQLSGEINQTVGHRLNARASEILSAVTDGKYTQIIISDTLAMHLLSDGRKIAIDRVSRGTAEQIYFALRIAAGEILYEEDYPLILDDTFAYYDEKRMENMLKWLVENKKQVLIFTCHKRELQILEQHRIPYHRCLFSNNSI